MAPPYTHNHLNLSTEPLHLHRRCSKAQMCFFNIIHIISSFPTPDVTHHNQIPQNKGLVVDLNLQLTGNCESFVAEDSELAVEYSEISHVGDQSSGVDYNEEAKPRDEGYLGLLIEAAQLILGDNSNQDKKPPAAAARGRGAKRKQQCNWTAAAEAEWYAEFEDTSPVVKSKRGRNQVLPFKYRDSVVEPLVRWTPSSKSKRRSK